MAVSEQDVRHVAELARLGVSPAQLPRLVAELNSILGHMEVLAAVRTEGVEVTSGVGASSMPLRSDQGPPLPLLREREAFAPAVRDGFLLVPRLASHVALGASVDDLGDEEEA